MSEHDPMRAIPKAASPDPRSRKRAAGIGVALVLGVAAIGAFAGSSFSQGLRRGLVNVPETTVTDASFEGRFGDFGPGWASVLPNSVIEAFIDSRADRMLAVGVRDFPERFIGIRRQPVKRRIELTDRLPVQIDLRHHRRSHA